ncbi:hypothetical protein [Robiginitalea aurantiaca]|uniref:Lipoprotein n=1 Tax=Robiginitalea aurantiaca TaxID=3056915 RepID=A0ABT7WEX4_9FLAO|nr:hypothetical protein [Robiginitalea aurantiaca]MDM9631467.1 hypothetical protein [Robiginitalea aurantiaca]
MKRFILCLFLTAVVTSCDPASVMDANIENKTSQPLSLILFSSVVPNETLVLRPGETLLFQEGFSSTGGFLEPSLMEFDSVYIESTSQEILKVFNQNTAGKNIFNVDDYWIFSEPSKRFYKYDYQITAEDIE